MANPIPLVQSPAGSGQSLDGAIPVTIAGIDSSDKAEIAALTALAGGADLPAVVAKVNQVIAALKA